MPDGVQAPTGLARRRRRISDEETERRMLLAATEMINSAGLTVSLDHISFEDVIRDAGVARSAVYRRWPYKDLFFSDLLVELAAATGPATVPDEDAATATISALALDRLERLATPDLRRSLWIELLRSGALSDVEAMAGSTAWRTYLALHATFLSLADGEVRATVQAALARSEQRFVARIAASWERFAGLFGLRIRPALDADYGTIAGLASATLRGAAIMSTVTPAVVAPGAPADPFGTGETAVWSPVAVAVVSIAQTYLEPDPDIAWDDGRVAAVRAALTLGRGQ